MGFENIRYEKDGRVATITVDRPAKRNALDTATYGEIQAALDDANADSEIRVIVLTGAGDRVFAAGADLSYVNTLTPMEYRRYLETNAGARTKIRQLDKPVIARVNGVAFGGAMGLATACDIVVASNTARFAQREIAVGLLGGVVHLASVGRARTAEIMLTGEPISADEAFQMGLINRVVPPEQLDEAVQDYVDKIASKSPIGLKLTKRALNVALEVGFAEAEAFQYELVLACFTSEDRREGMNAFLEKRQPQFTGR